MKCVRPLTKPIAPGRAKHRLMRVSSVQLNAAIIALKKIIFESRPGCLVTAHLYVPDKTRWTSTWYYWLLWSCCRWQKMHRFIRHFVSVWRAMVLSVLIYDPFNQGERDQYYALHSRESVRSSTHAPQYDGQTTRTCGRMVWRVARMGW